MEDVPAQEVAVEIEGEEDGDELVEVDLSAYEERIAELEAALADEKERSAQLQAKVVDLEMQLREAQSGGGGGAAPPPPPPAPAAPAPPPPPAAGGAPPPPPPAGGPPPPPPPSAGGPARGGAADPRAGLLNAIEGFSKGKLKKAQTVDKSGPVTTAEKASGGGGGGGGGGNSIAAMAAAKRSALKSAPGVRTKSGRITKEQADANRSAALNLINLKSAGVSAAPAGGAAAADSPGPTTIDFRAGLKRSTSPPSPAAPAASPGGSPSPALNVTLRKAQPPAAGDAPAAESSSAPSPGLNVTLRRANTTPLQSTQPAADSPTGDFRSGLKSLNTGADKTVSGRYKAPKAATGPAPEMNFRAGLKRTGPL